MYSTGAYQPSSDFSASSSSFSSSSFTSSSSLCSKDPETSKTAVKNFFLKSTHIISKYRSPTIEIDVQQLSSSEIELAEKWFNIKLAPANYPKQELEVWESYKSDDVQLPPLIIETYLDLREHVGFEGKLYMEDDLKNRWQVMNFNGKKPKNEIVLERWLIELEPKEQSTSNRKKIDVQTMYSNSSNVLKDLVKYINNQPATALKNRMDSDSSHKFSVNFRILNPNSKISSKGRIGLSKSIIGSDENNSHIDLFDFKEVETTFGTVKISCTFRKNCKFSFSSVSSNSTTKKKSTRTSSINSVNTKPESPNSTPTPPHTPITGTNVKSSVGTVPNFHRSNSNVSLAALLRAQRNSFTGSANSNNSGSAGVISSNSITNPNGSSSIFIQRKPSNLHNRSSPSVSSFDSNENSSGIAIKYSSSFNGSKVHRNSLLSLNENSRTIGSLSRTNSIKTTFSYYDNNSESLSNVSESIYSDLKDFVSEIDMHKNKFKRSMFSGGERNSYEHDNVNLERSLNKFQLMKETNDLMSENLSSSLMVSDKLQISSTSPVDPPFTSKVREHLYSLHHDESPDLNYKSSDSKESKRLSFNSPFINARRNSSTILDPTLHHVYGKLNLEPANYDELEFEDY